MNAAQNPKVRQSTPSTKFSHSRFSTSALGRFVSKRRISRLVKNQTHIIQRHLETGSLKALVTIPVFLAALSVAWNSSASQPTQPPSSATQATGAPAASLSAKAIPFDEIGAAAGKQYSGNGLAATATKTGAWLNCVFQKLEGDATSEGLWLTSTVTNTVKYRFRVKAMAVGRETSFLDVAADDNPLILTSRNFPSPFLDQMEPIHIGCYRET